jgi:hypothetical protein
LAVEERKLVHPKMIARKLVIKDKFPEVKLKPDPITGRGSLLFDAKDAGLVHGRYIMHASKAELDCEGFYSGLLQKQPLFRGVLEIHAIPDSNRNGQFICFEPFSDSRKQKMKDLLLKHWQ